MKLLNRESILGASDLKTEQVEVPEWGGAVLVRTLSGVEYGQYTKSVLIRKGRDSEVNMMIAVSKLAAVSVVDEEGKRIFTDADIAALGQKSAAALNRIFHVASRLSGIGEEDLKDLTEELKENPLEDSASV